MAAKKRGLGRGLDALLGGDVNLAETGRAGESATKDGVDTLPLDLLQRGRYQPRRDFNPERLQELADSIAAQGVVQPIVVRPIAGERYEIVAGERRWRAAQQAGLDEIPVVIRDIPDQTAMAMALIENIQRDDLKPLEEASALHRLLNEFELTHQEVAKAVGKSRTTVTNLLRLLDLEAEVKQLLDEGRLEMGHGRALLGLKGATQSKAARQVVSRGLSVRETEKLVRQMQAPAGKGGSVKQSAKQDPNIRQLEERLAATLGAKVKLKTGSAGKGQLIISYNSSDELDGILDHIK
jgi:ParB family chromosome partitioning protein